MAIRLFGFVDAPSTSHCAREAIGEDSALAHLTTAIVPTPGLE